MLSALLSPVRRFLGMRLHWQILWALLLGLGAGLLVNRAGGEAALVAPKLGPLTWMQVFNFVADMFMRALKMVIVPLIAASIIVGVSGIGSARDLGRLSVKTLLFYAVTTVVAVVTGLAIVDIVQPGRVDGAPAAAQLGLQNTAEAQATAAATEGGLGSLAEIFLRMIPDNPIRAAAEGDILAVILFSILLGFFISQAREPHRGTMRGFFEALFDVMTRMTTFVIAFIPIGTFALVAKMVATTGVGGAGPLMRYFFCVVAALAFHMFVTMPLIVRALGRVSPLKHYKAMAPALLTAFSTASSSGTLPLTMECTEKNAGVSNRIASFVLPLGATVNMNGTALYECVAAIFIAQAYGMELHFSQQLIVVITASLAGVGTAGIPAAGLVTMAIILNALGWPLEGIVMILAVDRPLDMMRTTVNVYGDTCAAAVIATSEGERPTFPQSL